MGKSKRHTLDEQNAHTTICTRTFTMRKMHTLQFAHALIQWEKCTHYNFHSLLQTNDPRNNSVIKWKNI